MASFHNRTNSSLWERQQTNNFSSTNSKNHGFHGVDDNKTHEQEGYQIEKGNKKDKYHRREWDGDNHLNFHFDECNTTDDEDNIKVKCYEREWDGEMHFKFQTKNANNKAKYQGLEWDGNTHLSFYKEEGSITNKDHKRDWEGNSYSTEHSVIEENELYNLNSKDQFPKLSYFEKANHQKFSQIRDMEINILKSKLKEETQKNNVITTQIKLLQQANNKLKQINIMKEKKIVEQQQLITDLENNQLRGFTSRKMITKFTQTVVPKKSENATQVTIKMQQSEKFSQTRIIKKLDSSTQSNKTDLRPLKNDSKSIKNQSTQVGHSFYLVRTMDTQTCHLTIATKGIQTKIKQNHRNQQTELALVQEEHNRQIPINSSTPIISLIKSQTSDGGDEVLQTQTVDSVLMETKATAINKQTIQHFDKIPSNDLIECMDSGFCDDSQIQADSSSTSLMTNKIQQLINTPIESTSQESDMKYPKRKKKLLILNLPEHITEKDLLSSIGKYNNANDIKLQKFIPSKSKKGQHALLQLPEIKARQLLQNKRLQIEERKYSIVPFLQIRCCRICQNLDHSEATCIYKTLCYICGSKHSPSSCSHSNHHTTCKLCYLAGRTDVNHGTSSLLCSTYRYYKKLILKQLYDNYFNRF